MAWKKKKCETSFSFCSPPISGRTLSDAAKKRSISLLASGAETDVRVSNAISVMKCKGAGSSELLNKAIFHSSNIPFFSPTRLFILSNPGSEQTGEEVIVWIYFFCADR